MDNAPRLSTQLSTPPAAPSGGAPPPPPSSSGAPPPPPPPPGEGGDSLPGFMAMARPFSGASEELKCEALTRVMADCCSSVTTYFTSASATGGRCRTSQVLSLVCGPGTVYDIIPAGIRELCDERFKRCSSLPGVTFGPSPSLERIGVEAFGAVEGDYGGVTKRGLVEINIPDSVRELCDGCFRGCASLRRVTFGPSSSLERIGVEAFGAVEGDYGEVTACGLVEISIPDNVRELCDRCFRGCASLRRVTFGPSSCLERIGDLCFGGVGLVGFKIPPSVKHLGKNLFESGRTSRRRF